MAKSILRSISALMITFLLVFTIYVLNKMLRTKNKSYQLAKTKKEKTKRRRKKNLRKKLIVEPKKQRDRKEKKKKSDNQVTATVH